jgi:hypothetical protein
MCGQTARYGSAENRIPQLRGGMESIRYANYP